MKLRPRVTDEEYQVILEMRRAAGKVKPAAIGAAESHYARGFEKIGRAHV